METVGVEGSLLDPQKLPLLFRLGFRHLEIHARKEARHQILAIAELSQEGASDRLGISGRMIAEAGLTEPVRYGGLPGAERHRLRRRILFLHDRPGRIL